LLDMAKQVKNIAQNTFHINTYGANNILIIYNEF